MKAKLFNYLGQLRVYSLVDLVMLLHVAGASWLAGYWAVMSHISFLLFLESQHKHPGREPVRQDFAGVLMYWAVTELAQLRDKNSILLHDLGGAYVIFSVLYSLKNKKRWGLFSPIARGIQTAIMLAFFVSPASGLFLAAVPAMIIRNLVGDGRDVVHDRVENMRTWPILWRWKRNSLFLLMLHLFATVATTWLWWWFGRKNIFWIWPAALTIVQVTTYYLTPRRSNKRALAKLRRLARRLGIQV